MITNDKKYFIFTEVYSCTKIGNIALKSFHKHNNFKVHIYGSKKDLDLVEFNENNILVCDESPNIIQGFNNGHLGTAKLWAKIIKNSDYKFIIHFDSDVIFRDNVIDELFDLLNKYDLVGTIRNYKHNPNNINNVRHLQDITQTSFFGFNKNLIDNFDIETLEKMCRGSYNPLGHPIIDFFDPVMFNILKNKGKVYHLNQDDYGGCDFYGQRNNIFKEINNSSTPFKIDFGNKMSHFSAVGSGMRSFNDRNINVPNSYKQYAIDRYALFCKVFYNEDLGIDVSKYKSILEIKHWF